MRMMAMILILMEAVVSLEKKVLLRGENHLVSIKATIVKKKEKERNK